MFRSQVRARVVHVPKDGDELGVVVARLSPRFGRKTLLLDGFPLSPSARRGIAPGQAAILTLTSATRPISLAIEGRMVWQADPAPGRYHARALFASDDARRRKAIFAAHDLPDRATAIAVASSKPEGIPSGLEVAWRDVLTTTSHPERDELDWVWYGGDPSYGRDMTRGR